MQYILDRAATRGMLRVDLHWRPIWAACPFCLVDFDVVGRMDTFDQDSDIVVKLLGVEVGQLGQIKKANYIIVKGFFFMFLG